MQELWGNILRETNLAGGKRENDISALQGAQTATHGSRAEVGKSASAYIL